MVVWSGLSLNPIAVAPIGLAFFSASGLRVAAIETGMFLPLIVYGLVGLRYTSPKRAPHHFA